METLAISVLVLLLSGFGFITYRHPLIARKIIIITMGIVVSIIVGSVMYLIWENDSYVNWDNNLYEYQPTIYNTSDFDLDSIKNVSRNSIDYDRKLDSLNKQMSRVSRENYVKSQVYSGILNELRKAEEATKKDIVSSLIYSIIGLIALIVLLILSYTFQNLWKHNSNKNDESPPKTPD